MNTTEYDEIMERFTENAQIHIRQLEINHQQVEINRRNEILFNNLFRKIEELKWITFILGVCFLVGSFYIWSLEDRYRIATGELNAQNIQAKASLDSLIRKHKTN